jgi:hypothetical protein
MTDGLTTIAISNFVSRKKALDYANASINRWFEALHRAFTPGFRTGHGSLRRFRTFRCLTSRTMSAKVCCLTKTT